VGIVSCIELPRERELNGRYGESYRYKRGFMVKVDDPSTPLSDISLAAGVRWLDQYPDDPSCVALELDLKPESNSLLHYVLTINYAYPPSPQGQDKPPNQPPDIIPGIPTLWTATSSVSTVPLMRDVNGNVIKNSAGVPMDKLETEEARFRLSLKRPWVDLSWRQTAKEYTNTVNKDNWMGGTERCWKCQGMTAAPESINAAGITVWYWMTTWEFEYRAPWKKITLGAADRDYPGWDRGITDRGYQAKVDDAGQPDTSPSSKVGTVRDRKGQPIKEPVGLRNGEAVAPGEDPDTLIFVVFKSKDFTPVFGNF